MKKISALIFVLILAVVLCFSGCRETGGADNDVSSVPQVSVSNEYEVIDGGTGGIDFDSRESGEDDFESSASSGEEGSSSSSDLYESGLPDNGTISSESDEPNV